MTIETMITLSRVVLGLAIVLAGLSVVLFFVLDINRAWHLVTGKQIVEKKNTSKKNSKTGLKDKSQSTGVITDKIATAQTSSNNQQAIPNISITEETTFLNAGNNATTLLQNGDPAQGTAVLHTDGTTLLNVEGTTLLNKEGTTLLNDSSGDEYADPDLKIEEEISYIHTDIRI